MPPPPFGGGPPAFKKPEAPKKDEGARQGKSVQTGDLRKKVDLAKKVLAGALQKKKEQFESRELHWLELLKEKDREITSIREELKGTVAGLKTQATERESSLRSAMQKFERHLRSLQRRKRRMSPKHP